MKELYPYWAETYKDLPRIPESKRWLDNHSTYEQIITAKLVNNQSITQKEEQLLIEAINFYRIALPQLQNLNLASFTLREIENLKNYFNYVFNYIVLLTNDLHVSRLVRLVENESVIGKKERITETRYLSYPPLEIVQAKNQFNRANTPNYNLFYATDSIDNALMEIKPAIGTIVTVGFWKPKNISEIQIVSYPISHNPLAIQVNPNTRHGYLAFQELKKKIHPLLSLFLSTMFRFISDEYAKPVTHHLQYLFSALLSERILEVNEVNPDFTFDCIIYPSVGNRLQVENVAIKPYCIDRYFQLYEVKEFEIVRTHYEKIPFRINPEHISVVDYKNLKSTNQITNDGFIEW